MAAFTSELLAAYRRPTLSRAALDAVRLRRRVALLTAAAEAPFYARHLSRAAIREGRLDAVPQTTKQAFQEALEDTFAGGGPSRARLIEHVRDPARAGTLLDDRWLVAMTSGTTGAVATFVNDVTSWARTRAVTFARIFREQIIPAEVMRLADRRFRMGFVVATGGHYMTALLASRMPRIGALFCDARTWSVEMPIAALVDELNRFAPHLLHSYPTVMELLAAEKRAGRLVAEPDQITLGSEPLLAGARRSIAAAFPRARIVETYAATECVGMATSCPAGHLHVNEDACALEPVDEHGMPVRAGRPAERALVTNLLNTAQPLVRYELTDQVELVDDEAVGPCACRSSFARVRVHGRTDDTFFLVDDTGLIQAHAPIPLELVFLSIPGLKQFQLIHDEQNRLKVSFVVDDGGDPSAVARRIDGKLYRYLDEHGLGARVGFVLEEVDTIERHWRGRKLRQITSRVLRPTDEAVSAASVRERRRRPRDTEDA